VSTAPGMGVGRCCCSSSTAASTETSKIRASAGGMC
jgi:hypothetical protein